MFKHLLLFVLISHLFLTNCEIIIVVQADQNGGAQKEPDYNCKIQKDDASCQQCYPGFYYDRFQQFKCVPANQQCQTYDKDGRCLTCFDGYQVDDGECVLIKNLVSKFLDKNCAIFSKQNPSICQRCSFKYFFNENNVCTQVDPNCESWTQEGRCQNCYPGLDLINHQCFAIAEDYIPISSIAYCKDPIANGQGQIICEQCVSRSVLIDNSCYKVSDLCQTWGNDGFCTSCYQGYQQEDGRCLLQNKMSQNQTEKSENYCLKVDENGYCEKCIFRYYLRFNGYCAQVSDLCKQWNNQTGQCTDCYKGYQLEEGACFIPDEKCAIKSIYQGCVQCVDRHYLGPDGRCVLVNVICDKFNPFNGKCESCIDGYEYKGKGICQKIEQ